MARLALLDIGEAGSFVGFSPISGKIHRRPASANPGQGRLGRDNAV
jgi:hypothetical protein